jgi:hypothetical protein
VLSQRFTKVQAERDELYSKFEASVYEVQQKTGLKSALLEKKIEVGDGGRGTSPATAAVACSSCCAHRAPRHCSECRKNLFRARAAAAPASQALGEVLEMKEAQLAEVLTAANLDPGTLAAINQRLEEVLDNKNQVWRGPRDSGSGVAQR